MNDLHDRFEAMLADVKSQPTVEAKVRGLLHGIKEMLTGPSSTDLSDALAKHTDMIAADVAQSGGASPAGSFAGAPYAEGSPGGVAAGSGGLPGGPLTASAGPQGVATASRPGGLPGAAPGPVAAGAAAGAYAQPVGSGVASIENSPAGRDRAGMPVATDGEASVHGSV